MRTRRGNNGRRREETTTKEVQHNFHATFSPKARTVQTLVGLHLKAVQPATTNINLKATNMFFVSIYLKTGEKGEKITSSKSGQLLYLRSLPFIKCTDKEKLFLKKLSSSLPPFCILQGTTFSSLHRFMSQFLCTIILVVWFKHSFFKLKRLDDKNWRHVSFES